jgi:hypothetical protein
MMPSDGVRVAAITLPLEPRAVAETEAEQYRPAGT